MSSYRTSNSPYINSNSHETAPPATPAISALSDIDEMDHDCPFKRSRSATVVSALTPPLAPCDTVTLTPVSESHSPQPEAGKSSGGENDGLQPLSTYYIPHEYVDINGARNKGFAPVAASQTSQGCLKLPPADEKKICGQKRSMFFFLVLLGIILGLGVGLGAGLGLGLKQGSKISANCPASSESTSTSTPTATTSPSSTVSSVPSTGNIVDDMTRIECPGFNNSIITSLQTPSNDTSSSNPSSPIKKWQVLCDRNIAPSASKKDLAWFTSSTLGACFAVCDSMSFFTKRDDISAVWNYDGSGSYMGKCWCVGFKEGYTTGKILMPNKGISAAVIRVDDAGTLML